VDEAFEARYAAWGRQGTRPEFIVWEYLTKTKKQIEGTDFVWQSSMLGGRMTFAGVVIDFWLLPFSMMWRVQGEYFHSVNVQDRTRDQLDRMRLEEMGYTVIDLWANDLQTRGRYTLDLAWRGQELPSPMSV
jgi:very-short-patch-repair endonuclease